MLKIESGNEVVLDGWTDGWMETQPKFMNGRSNIIPALFKKRVVKREYIRSDFSPTLYFKGDFEIKSKARHTIQYASK